MRFGGKATVLTNPIRLERNKANGYGLFDMNGNVGELVWNDDNEEDECDVCGGNYSYDKDECEVDSVDDTWYRSFQEDDVGFRIVRNVD